MKTTRVGRLGKRRRVRSPKLLTRRSSDKPLRTKNLSGSAARFRRSRSVVILPAPGELRPVNFEFYDQNADSVCLAGSFNDWNPHVSPLRNVRAGGWALRLLLAPGRYEYRFLVDGQWRMDPRARQQVTDFCGGVNSVLTVQ